MSNQTNTSTESSQAMKSVLNWFEIPVSDAARSIPVYSAMLDQKLASTDYNGSAMVILGSNGCLIAGAPRDRAPKGGTVVYLNAHDGVRACLARAVEAGAKVVVPETSIGPHGTIAQIEDLDGNIVGLHAVLAK